MFSEALRLALDYTQRLQSEIYRIRTEHDKLEDKLQTSSDEWNTILVAKQVTLKRVVWYFEEGVCYFEEGGVVL